MKEQAAWFSNMHSGNMSRKDSKFFAIETWLNFKNIIK